MVSDDILKAQLSRTLDRTDFPELGEKYQGKVRDCYVKGGKRIIVVTDRLSAFDVVLGTIPFKGQVLNQIAAHWFQLSRQVSPNHVLSVPDPVVTVGVECKLLPVEWVMRSYLTGVTSTSIWRHYEQGAREFCGHRLPEGMRKNQRLAEAILTPSTKADKGGHDESVSREEILKRGLLKPEEFDEAAQMCARLFAFGQAEAAKRGLILVDTKYVDRPAPRRHPVLHRRDPHARQLSLLVRRRLPGALRPGGRAPRAGQGVRPAHAGRAGLPRRGAAAAADR